MCSVDLSDVTARSWLLGEMEREKILAGSTPRRSSAIRAQLLVAKTRTRVPYTSQLETICGWIMGQKRQTCSCASRS